MDLQLKNKTALVSGSTAGIGLAIAQSFAQEGASVIVNGRTRERVDAAVQQVQTESRQATVKGVAADLGTEEGAAQVTRAAPDIDILVNNLGMYEAKPFGQLSDQDWLKIFQVNVLSGVRLSRYYLPKMLAQNWGRIAFISSESALNIPVEMIHYGVTKTAQVAVARGLAEMTAGTKVTVNSILAGPTRSEGVENFLDNLAKAGRTDVASLEKDFFRTVRPSSLLKRFETPEEVAVVTVFVCSPLASGINGAALRVEGGVVRSII